MTSWHEDHPRVCGEKLRARDKISAPWGSPPRMRGKATGCALSCLFSRITPAYAGKRLYIAHCRLWCLDHPRVCGEKCFFKAFCGMVLGSPPRMRGKVRAMACPLSFPEDHPRVCGEKRIAGSDELALEGSPPRMRGKVGVKAGSQVSNGITPAYAGKSLS